MATNIGYAAPEATAPLAPLCFDRPLVSPQDVRIDIKSYGVCHSDLHQARNESGGVREEGTA
jgi:alcohol dehydrogenase (NADP+)